ncbi:MAG: nicotinamide-nucleotide adenylyltransferase [Candidatus Lokiarchaeota archaeon]|nr:nicotinamide-nucleotide adenylyltransferase [Candidatus Harpocratesius repetitus]
MNLSPNFSQKPPCKRKKLFACFNPKDLPKFHTGKLSSFVFGKTLNDIRDNHIAHLYFRIFAWSTKGSLYIIPNISQNSMQEGLKQTIMTDSAHGYVIYSPTISFENIAADAWQNFSECLKSSKIYGRLYDFHIEQDKYGVVAAVYSFIALLKENLTQFNSNLSSKSSKITNLTAKIIPIKEAEQFFNQHPIDSICRYYWQKMIHENIFYSLQREYQRESEAQNQFQKKKIQIDLKKEKNQQLTKDRRDQSIKLLNTTNKIGLFVGRFQPFHLGHLQVIKNALTQVKILKIGIGSSQYHSTPQNPFTYHERLQMIQAALEEADIPSQNIQVFPIPDKHNADLWVQTVFDIVGNFDIFFSNSAWTRQLFQKHGKAVAPLQKYEFEQFNGTFIRNCIKNGEQISNLVPTAVENYIKSNIKIFSKRFSFMRK